MKFRVTTPSRNYMFISKMPFRPIGVFRLWTTFATYGETKISAKYFFNELA